MSLIDALVGADGVSISKTAKPHVGKLRHLALHVGETDEGLQGAGLNADGADDSAFSAMGRAAVATMQFGVPFLTIGPLQPPENAGRRWEQSLLRELSALGRSDIRICALGGGDRVSSACVAHLQRIEIETRANSSLTLIVQMNRDSRREISDAVRRLLEGVALGSLSPDAIDEKLIAAQIRPDGVPELDLIISYTSNRRLSNYLLWQAAYSEFVFLQERWSQFSSESLRLALAEFDRRHRRFGGVS